MQRPCMLAGAGMGILGFAMMHGHACCMHMRACRALPCHASYSADTLQELLVNVAPKKANWDLKRDIQPKLDKLERRTQRAIIEIMQEEVGGACMHSCSCQRYYTVSTRTGWWTAWYVSD